MRVGLTLIVAFAAGCFDPKLDDEPFVCGPGPDPCPPGYTCDDEGVCVRELTDGGPPGPCQIGTTTCEGDTLVTCPNGTRQETTCPVGCEEGNGARCLVLVPTDLPASTCSAPVSGTLRISSDRSFDTDVCEGGVKIDDPPRCVVTVAQLILDPGATLTAIGSRIPVLVATQKLRIHGRIEAGGDGIISGPGYAAAVEAGRGETADSSSSDGGGGAGHATKGGEAGAKPGEPYGNVELSPILPGAPGGGGGLGCETVCPLDIVASGGGAGGAIHIVACQELELGTNATLSAGGGGGPGGHGGSVFDRPGGGGGGGSGGSVLIEAPRIAVVAGAGIGANGGGGGGAGARGGDFTGPSGEPGENAPVSRQPAHGGPGGNDTAGAGGDGGTADGQGSGLPPGRGGDNLSGGGGGGGGGAAGRIRLNSRSDKPPSVAGVVSPAPSIGSIERR